MDDIKKAADIIKSGGIIIFPTDTAYGIGCSLENEKAIRKLFKIRKRPVSQATPVLFNSISQVRQYVPSFNNDVSELMRLYWPGALTIVLKCKIDKVSPLVRGGGETLGARIPNNEKILEIIKLAQVPILGPSANFHNKPTPFSFEELDSGLVKLVDFVIKGEAKLKKPSTVLDCSVRPWRIMREGAIKVNL
jgi:L-threonylcarbamoyladenylate synthase